MTLNVSDKNNYLKGIISLIGTDDNCDEKNKKIVRLIAEKLGFNHYFVDDSINEIKKKKYIEGELLEFSNQEIAQSFIKDAIRIAFLNHIINSYDIKWLSNIAFKNKLTEQWLTGEINYYFFNKNSQSSDLSFEILKQIES